MFTFHSVRPFIAHNDATLGLSPYVVALKRGHEASDAGRWRGIEGMKNASRLCGGLWTFFEAF